jgi:hypothetical protein
MKGKTFLILLVAAGVLVALSFLRFGGEKHTGAVKMGDRLFADLPVNTVAGITIADAENRVTLVKGEKVWQVEERNGYPADFDELRDTVVKLSRLKIGRSFTGSPESLARLSLTSPSAPDNAGAGRQITLRDRDGNILADLILGQIRETDDGGTGGQYLKKAGADTVFLVDGDFRFLKTAPAEWLKKEVLDIRADDVASVACYAGDAPTPVYTLSRPEKGEAARMTPVPPERTADSAKIDQVLDALAPLALDDVKAGKENPPAAESHRPRLVYHLYDGRRISIFPESDGEDSFFLRITAEADPSVAEAVESAAPETDEDQPQAEETKPSIPKTARQINEELSPWVFSVKKWQFDSFITQPESLLEAVKTEGEGSS